MLKRVRFRRRYSRHNKYGYAAFGSTLLKPRRLLKGMLDVKEEHLAFLDGNRKPVTYNEKQIHALLVHENTHSERWKWWLSYRYRFSKRFRLNEEKHAYKAQIGQLAHYGIPISIRWIATAMSSPVYRRMISFDDALAWARDTVFKAGDLEYTIACIAADRHFISYQETEQEREEFPTELGNDFHLAAGRGF